MSSVDVIDTYLAKHVQELGKLVEKDKNTRLKPHNLCSKCRHAVTGSIILSDSEGPDHYTRCPEFLSADETHCWYEDFPHYDTLESLAVSATGCHLCTVLLYHCWPRDLEQDGWWAMPMRSLQSDVTQSTKEEPLIELENWRGLIIRIRHYVYQGATEERSEYDSRSFVIGDAEQVERSNNSSYGTILISKWGAFSTYGHGTPVSTASASSFALANEWIKSCVQDHPLCQSAYCSAMALPTRLVDLGHGDLNSVKICRTVTIPKENCEDRVRYVVLSHRWPKKPIKLLTKENYSQFCKTIEWDELSATFQDAFLITKELGIRYIWVDSLCIIQNDNSDWQKESAIMGDIYRGSICSIGVTDPSARQAHFFSNRNPLKQMHCALGRGRWNAYLTHKDHWDISDHELMSRGWVLQERILSPRSLYYDADGIKWECTTSGADDKSPLLKEGSRGLRYGKTNLSSLFEELNLDESEAVLDFHRHWDDLVHYYTSCSLTRGEDKLVTIEGIIKKIGEKTGMHAIAGLWRQLLPAELLWYNVGVSGLWHNIPDPSQSALRSKRAPSWSWASLDPIVRNEYTLLAQDFFFSFDWHATVDAIKIGDKTDPRTLYANMLLQAPLEKMHWGNETPSLIHEVIPPENELEEPVGIATPLRDYWYSDTFTQIEGDVYVLLITRAICELPLEEFTNADGTIEAFVRNKRRDMYIVVKPVDGQEGVYERIGYYEHHFVEGDTPQFFNTPESLIPKQIVLI